MKIFISHSSHDKWVARQLSNLLEQDQHTTFLDEKDIKTGESIDTAIQQHLKDSDHVLLLLSPASLTSQWVFIELGGAKALGKHIVPVLFHVAGNEIPHAISQLLARDINDIDKYLEELRKLSALAKVSPKKVAAAEAKTEALAKRESQSSVKSMNGLKIGDRVRIVAVDLLTEEDKSEHPKWVKGMDKYSGVVTQITRFTPRGSAYLAVSGEEYRWSPKWFSKVE